MVRRRMGSIGEEEDGKYWLGGGKDLLERRRRIIGEEKDGKYWRKEEEGKYW